jgi:hypothetical protein
MRKLFGYPVLPPDHVFDKVRAIDLALAEFEARYEPDSDRWTADSGVRADAMREVRQRRA